MIEASVPRTTTRTQRGISLFLDRRREIERRTRNEWAVPSCSGAGIYLANVKTGACECPDAPHARSAGEVCKHVAAARLTMNHRAELRAMCRRERSRA